MADEEKTESEFGQGLTYCLGMFLAHAEKAWQLRDIYKKTGITGWPEMWFNGASDHLYDLILPQNNSEESLLLDELITRLSEFKSKCLEYGHGYRVESTEADVVWAIGEAKELLRLIDEQLLGIKTIEATWK